MTATGFSPLFVQRKSFIELTAYMTLSATANVETVTIALPMNCAISRDVPPP